MIVVCKYGYPPGTATVDASVYGLLHSLVSHPFPGPLQDFTLAQANLMAWHDRIARRYWA